MNKLKRIAALLLCGILLFTLLGGALSVFADGGVVGDESDVDVPFLPTKVLRSISIKTPPAKLVYLKGEALNTAGMVIKTTYTDNTTGTANASLVTVSGYDPNVLGVQTVTVKYSGKSTSFKVTVYSPGDANGDGALNGDDATLLLQYAAGWNVTVNTQFADANGDGKIDGADATLMLQYVAGWDVKLGK